MPRQQGCCRLSLEPLPPEAPPHPCSSQLSQKDSGILLLSVVWLQTNDSSELGTGWGAVSGGSWSPSPCAGELASGIGCNLPPAGNRMTKQNSSCCYRLPLMWLPWGLTSENSTALRPQHCPAAWRTCPRRCGTGAALTPKPQECVLRMLSEATAGVLGPQSTASGGASGGTEAPGRNSRGRDAHLVRTKANMGVGKGPGITAPKYCGLQPLQKQMSWKLQQAVLAEPLKLLQHVAHL